MRGKADIKLGYTCNNNCVHCVISDQRDRARTLRGSVDRGTNEFVRELEDARRLDVRDIVFTGGEPTIRKDLPVLLGVAREMGFRLHVQTNARMLAYRPLAEELAAFDATWVVALHGPEADVHDRVTRVSGSFEQTVQGVRHMRELGQRVVGKVVLSQFNAAFQKETIGRLVELGVPYVNVAFPHALGSARELFDEVVPRYADVVPHAHAALDRYADEAVVYYEAIPLCFMQGYEKHVAEYACLALKQPAVHKQLDMDTRDWKEARKEQKAKFPQCKRCKYDAVCEGPWKEYPERFGSEEFIPV